MDQTAARDMINMEENDDVFIESNDKEGNMLNIGKKIKDDPNKLSPLPWRVKSHHNSNSSDPSSSRLHSHSSHNSISSNSLSPFRRLSLSSSFFSCSTPPSTCHSARRHSSLLESLEVIFGCHSSPPPPVSAFQYSFLGQIYRSNLEKRCAVENSEFDSLQ